MTTINYSYFFQIELLHKYFADSLCNDFAITPTATAQSALRGNKVLVKQYGNKLYAGLQVDESNIPFNMPSADLQLTFFLELTNPLFFNYTNLPFTYQPGKLYYFTNRNTNAANGKNFITRSAPYDNARNYHPGDLAVDGSGVAFECISSCSGVVPSTANDNNWMKVDNNQYVSEADTVQLMPSVSTYTFSTPQANVSIDAFGYDSGSKDFTHQLIHATLSFAQSTKNFKLDLSALLPGKYKLRVNGVEQFIYINDEISLKSFAVIEIFNSSLDNNYKLLDGNILKSPLYTIYFLNRATIWKYVLHTSSKGTISVDPAGYDFPSAAASTILSQTPIPLSETPLDVTLTLSTINNVAVTPVAVEDVACASPQRLVDFLKGSDKYACSEIFLNY